MTMSGVTVIVWWNWLNTSLKKQFFLLNYIGCNKKLFRLKNPEIKAIKKTNDTIVSFLNSLS